MRSKEGEPSFELYVGDLLNFMRYCKIWKTDTFSRRKNIVVVLTIGLLLSSDLAVIVATLVDFENASNDLTSFAAYVGPLCLQCIGLVKWTYCIWRVNDVAQLVGMLEKCHFLSMRIDEHDLDWKRYKEEMEKTRSNYLRFLYGWLMLCIYGVLHWCSNPIVLEIRENAFVGETVVNFENLTIPRARNFPYLGWRPWNVNDNAGYVSFFFVQFVGALSSAIGSVTYDVFYVTSLMIVCAHLRYLNESLDDSRSTRVTRRTNVESLDFERKLKNCVDHHMEILTFLKTLEILASPVMFVQCFENIIVLCLVSLEASTIKVNTDLRTIMKLWSMLEYFLSVIAQLFVYCYYATEIRALGLQIADSAYMCSWERGTDDDAGSDGEKKSERRISCLVRMIMTRGQRAILLTGGPFYVLSLETFKSIVGLAMSNSVILRQVVEDRTTTEK